MRKTTIRFGLVSVPVSVFKATDENGAKLSQFHAGCNGAIGYLKVCKCCDQKVDSADIIKGRQVNDGSVVTVSEEELASVEVETGSDIEVIQFITPDEIDQISITSHYFTAPQDKSGVEGYTLLRTAMQEEGRIALVRFSLRGSGSVGKTHLGIIRIYQDNTLTLEGISFPDEIRKPEFSLLDNPVKLRPELVDMAKHLVQTMSGEFDPTAYTDEYSHKLNELIDAKSQGADVVPLRKAATDDTNVSDLLSKLRASVEAAPTKAAKTAVAAKKAPAKKAAAKKVSA